MSTIRALCNYISSILMAAAFAAMVVGALASGYPASADEPIGPQDGGPPACYCTLADCDDDENCGSDIGPGCPSSPACSDCGCFNIGGCDCYSNS